MVRSGPPGALHLFFVFCFAHSGWNDDDPNWRHPDGHVTDPSADCSGFQLSLLGMQMPSLALVGGSGRGWNVGKCECSVRIKCGKEFRLFHFFASIWTETTIWRHFQRFLGPRIATSKRCLNMDIYMQSTLGQHQKPKNLNQSIGFRRDCIGDLAQMVERSLSMREALGSMPRFSNFYHPLVFFYFIFFRSKEAAKL